MPLSNVFIMQDFKGHTDKAASVQHCTLRTAVHGIPSIFAGSDFVPSFYDTSGSYTQLENLSLPAATIRQAAVTVKDIKRGAQVTMTVEGVEFECNVTEYPSFIANLPTLQEPHYVLYTSDIDQASQQPWCPDCKHADPIVEEVIKQTGGTLLKVKVGDRTAWKSRDHPFRQDAQLHLTSIPTLIHWKADETSPGRRLDKQLDTGHSEAEVKQTVLAFTEQAKEQDL